MIISNFLPQIIAVFCFVILTFSIPVRQKKITERCGKCLMPLRRAKSAAEKSSVENFSTIANSSKIISMFFVCILVVAVTFFRRLGSVGTSVICAAAVLAFELAVRNYLLLKNSGIYEKGIYLQHPFILYEEIQSIPALLWEDADISEKLDFQIVMKNSANINLIFQNTEEARTVLNQIKKIRPDLVQG